MKNYLATVISVNYHSSALLHALEAKLADIADVELVIVDNSGEFRKQFSSTRLIRSGRNLGFGAASNLGANEAKGDVLIFLNPDALISSEGIRTLVHNVNKIGSCILGPIVRDNNNLIPTLRSSKSIGLKYRREYLYLSNEHSEFIDVLYISGACLAINKKLFSKLTGFCPSIFLYAEDLDLCARARDIGIRVGLVPSVEIFHMGGKSSSRFRDRINRLFRSIKGHYIFMRKNHSVTVSLLNSIYLASGVRW